MGKLAFGIDDRESYLTILRHFGKRNGYEVKTFSSVTEAEKAFDDGEVPDIIVARYEDKPRLDSLGLVKRIMEGSSSTLCHLYTRCENLAGKLEDAISNGQLKSYGFVPWCDIGNPFSGKML